jgi:hypothetical protein
MSPSGLHCHRLVGRIGRSLAEDVRRVPDCDFGMKELIHDYGAWIVFLLVFLESIGLPLPGEAILVSAAIFAGRPII